MCLLLFSSKGIGQYYRLIDADRDMTYARLAADGSDSIFYFIKTTDFTLEGTDTVYYFNNQLLNIGTEDCLYQTGDTSIFGYKVKILSDEDTTYVFFNQHNDSIFIKSQIEVGNTWRVYTWPDGNWVKATVINKLERIVLPDIADTLMRVQLNVFTEDGTIMPDIFPDDTKIDISKNYGLTEFFNFNIFPEPGDSIGRVLRGLSNPYVNIVDVNSETAFDFETGYEFHYREVAVPDDILGVDQRISAWKYFVLDKTELADGVSYTMERIKFDTLITDGITTSNMVWDTIEVAYVYADYAFLDTLELMVLENNLFGYGDWNKVDTIYKGIAYKEVYSWYNYDDATLCLSNPDEINNPEQIYGQGMGTIHYLDSIDAEQYYALDLTYFHIGLLEWGTPYDFSAFDVAINDLQKAEMIIYPNPATQTLTIKTSDAQLTTVSIVNLSGEILLQQSKSPGTVQSIDIAHLSAGLYQVVLLSDAGIQTATFIKL